MGGKTIKTVGAAVSPVLGAVALADTIKDARKPSAGETAKPENYITPYFEENRQLLLDSLKNYAAKTGWKIDPTVLENASKTKYVGPVNSSMIDDINPARDDVQYQNLTPQDVDALPQRQPKVVEVPQETLQPLERKAVLNAEIPEDDRAERQARLAQFWNYLSK